MLSRLAYAQTAFSPLVKNAFQQIPKRQPIFRQFTRDTRQGVTRGKLREEPTLKERMMAPPGPNGE
jgi:hypothetical protein